jgi:CHAT domain-containing protein
MVPEAFIAMAKRSRPLLATCGETPSPLNKLRRSVSESQVRFEDFVLQFDVTSRGGLRARVLKSPFGEGTVGFSLPSVAGGDPAVLNPLGISRGGDRDLDVHQGSAPALVAQPPLEMGTELFRSVFQGQVRTLLDKSRGQLEISPNLGLRLKIKIDPSDAETGALADLPWELLCDGETEDFFALSRQTSLVRYLDVPRSSQPIPFTPPLRILAVGASPHGMQPLDLDEETRRLEELNRSSPGVEVRFLPHASAGTVREALSEDTYNVLHFMGHGTFDRASGEGMLAFEAEDGSADLVSGKAFATKLRDLRSLGVVVLNACNTARAGHQGGTNPFRGVATALVLGGVPAVVAMQRPISDRAAIGFSTAFYRHLARGDSIDQALTEGRQAIHSAKPEAFEWATPVLFLRMPDGNVFVAKPAEKPEEPKPPAPALVAPPPPPPIALPAPRPVPPKRGMAIKVMAGAAGALLVVVLYFNLPKSTSLTGPQDGTSGDVNHPLTTENPIEIPHDPGKPPVITPDKDHAKGKNPVLDKKDLNGIETEHEQKPVQPEETPAQTPAPTPAPAADLSSLSAQVLSIARRDEGLRVTVSFNNASDLPLSVNLDAESSVLTDDKGGRNEIQGSDLSGSNLRLNLAGGASSSHTFDFPLPKRGSKKFYLFLSAQDGSRIKVTGSPVTLP